MHVSNFIMPVFGHVVRLSTTSTTPNTIPPTAAATTTTTTTTLRVYGSGESTYWHQLNRFVADVRAVNEAVDSGDEG